MRTDCQEQAMLAATNIPEVPAVRGATVLAVFESAEHAERAIATLQRQRFGAAQLSVIGKDDVGHVVAIGPVSRVLAGDAAEKAGARSVVARMLRLAGLSAGEIRTYESAVRGG